MTINDRFVRWQGITRNQFGYTINLVLTINIAILGYVANIKIDKPELYTCGINIGLIFIFISFISGVLINVSRLNDFRYTTRINNKKYITKWGRYRKCTKRLGKITWCLFYIQFAFFILGVGLLVHSIFC